MRRIFTTLLTGAPVLVRFACRWGNGDRAPSDSPLCWVWADCACEGHAEPWRLFAWSWWTIWVELRLLFFLSRRSRSSASSWHST